MPPGGEGGGERREAFELEEERRGRGQRSSSSPVLFVLLSCEGRDLLGADQWRGLAALSGIIGTGALSLVRPLSLRHLVDGRQFLPGIFLVIIVFLHVFIVVVVVSQNWEGFLSKTVKNVSMLFQLKGFE